MALAHDYQMQNNQLIIETKAALADYLLKQMQVNTRQPQDNPQAQQLLLVNKPEVEPWLFQCKKTRKQGYIN